MLEEIKKLVCLGNLSDYGRHICDNQIQAKQASLASGHPYTPTSFIREKQMLKRKDTRVGPDVPCQELNLEPAMLVA